MNAKLQELKDELGWMPLGAEGNEERLVNAVMSLIDVVQEISERDMEP